MQTAIAELYRVFEPYRLGADCFHGGICVDAEHLGQLAARPLAGLSAEDLDRYSQKAVTSMGDEVAFKHFLPRLLELAAQSPQDFLSIEVLFGKLDYARWQDWPNRERRAVLKFADRLWEMTLQSEIQHDGDDRADSLLCAFGCARIELAPCLAIWTTSASENAREHLAELACLNAPTLRDKGQLWNAYWPDDANLVDEIRNWLVSEEVEHFLDSGSCREPETIETAKWELESLRYASG